MLAAAVLPRAVGQHVAGVVEERGLAPPVELHHVGRGQVVQALEVGGHRGGERVEGHVLGAVRPLRVARDPDEHLVGVHELDERAALRALARAGEAGAGVLVRGEAPAGELAVERHHGVVDALGRPQVPGVARLLVVLGGPAEALREVDAVPGRDIPRPVRGALVVHAGEVEEPALAGPVVEPVDAVEVVGGPPLLPAAGVDRVEGQGGLPLEVARHQVEDAAVAGRLEVGPQRVEHHHVGPEVEDPRARLGVGEVGAAAEVAARLLRPHHRLEPALRLVEDPPVAGQVAEVDEALQPVRHLFPAEAALALRVRPGVAVELAEAAELRQAAREALGHEVELRLQPALGLHAAERELHERARQERLAVAGVVRVPARPREAGRHGGDRPGARRRGRAAASAPPA